MRVTPLAGFRVRQLPRGTRERLWLQADDDLCRPVVLPAMAVTGDAPGPVMLAVAGVHGNEYEGMEAIRQIGATLEPSRMRGAFLGIIIANPFAYEARSRATPAHIDGANLARVFPGTPDGTPSQRLAHGLLRFVTDNLSDEDLFIDLHSGSADVAYATLIGFRNLPGPAAARAEEAARHAGLPHLWRIPDAAGPFNAETARRGIPTVGTETTGRAGCDPHGVAAFVRALRGLLAFRGLCPDWPRFSRHAAPARDTVDICAPVTGFFRSQLRLHDRVEAGQSLGTIVDVFGDPLADICAPVPGEVWALRMSPPVRAGEPIAMIAQMPGAMPPGRAG